MDFNVPLDEEGNILDDTRIRSVLPTLNHALDEGAKVIVASHLGRPQGELLEAYSMKPCALIIFFLSGVMAIPPLFWVKSTEVLYMIQSKAKETVE